MPRTAADAKQKAEAAASNSATTSDRRTLAGERGGAGPDESLRLQEISTLLIREGNLDALYERVLDAAVGLMSADMGSMQTFYPRRVNFGCWPGEDFILNQPPSGNELM